MSALLLCITLIAVFIVISLACAVRIGRRPSIPPADPFSRPFGEMPGFTAEQLRQISRRSEERIARDPLRRSFITHPVPAPPSGGTRAAAVFLFPSWLAAARDFFRSRRHA